MPARPLVLIHGYSDRGDSFRNWVEKLQQRGYDVHNISVSNYQSLTNEITIKDIAEGLDRALRITAGLDEDQPFDAIVHSTGGLVIRAWLTAYQGNVDRLKHLIMLAPANFGSPMAHKGRSWLGALFKGRRELGPDFLEAGDRILAGLELASPFTWKLAQQDLVGDDTYYGPTKRTPYAFVFIGTSDYGWLKRAVTEPGTDGTVRWSGCALNCRKITIDLTRDPSQPAAPTPGAGAAAGASASARAGAGAGARVRAVARAAGSDRVSIGGWSNTDMPLVLVRGVNHGTIMSDAPDSLVDLVDSALRVSSRAAFEEWCTESSRITARASAARWQQFVVRAVDERGDPIPDYYLDFYTVGSNGRERLIKEIAADVHAFRGDQSFRCFHVNLDKLKPERLDNLYMRVRASSGTDFVSYCGFGSHSTPAPDAPEHGGQQWHAEVDLTDVLRQESDAAARSASFFYPYTTTLVTVCLNREPMPLSGANKVLQISAAGELWPS